MSNLCSQVNIGKCIFSFILLPESSRSTRTSRFACIKQALCMLYSCLILIENVKENKKNHLHTLQNLIH